MSSKLVARQIYGNVSVIPFIYILTVTLPFHSLSAHSHQLERSSLLTFFFFNMARCYDRNGRAYRCNSAWYDWGRWVALGIIILGAFLIFFLFR
jgi:hypothetical protein